MPKRTSAGIPRRIRAVVPGRRIRTAVPKRIRAAVPSRIIGVVPRRSAPHCGRAAMPEFAKGCRVDARECHDRSQRRNRRSDRRRSEHAVVGRGTAAVKSAALSGRRNRRDEFRPLQKWREYWPQFERSSHALCLRCQRPALYSALSPSSRGVAVLSRARSSGSCPFDVADAADPVVTLALMPGAELPEPYPACPPFPVRASLIDPAEIN